MLPKTDLSWKNAKSVHKKLNTKEFCFLCLKTRNIKVQDDEELEEISHDHFKPKINQPVSLLCVRRHLKLKLATISDNTSEDGEEEFEVDLCNGCKNVINKFSVLFQELEKVQMEMDYQLEKINLCISEGARSPELVQEYSKRMTSDVETLSQLALIDKIRKEISQKCLKVRIGLHQKVELPRVKIENITSSTLQVEGAIEDLTGEPDATFSVPASPSLPTAYDSDDSKVKLELQTNSKSHLSVTFLRDSLAGKFCCPSCDKSFGAKRTAEAHYESAHLNKKWKCVLCNVSFSKNYSNRHKKICRKKLQRQSEREKSRQHFKFQCATCGKRFPAKFLLQNHHRAVHSNSQLTCDPCKKTFKSPECFHMHKRNMHPAVAVSCKYCSTTFKTSPACRYHQKKCPQRSVLKTEAKSAPQPILIAETGMYRCPSCTKTYPRPATVRLHYNSVHLKKKINCDLCNIAAFTDPSSLLHHKKTCLDTLQKRLKDLELRKSYQIQCQTCGKKFRTRKCLSSHTNVAHASIRRFRCDHCEMSFTTGAQLRNHRDSVHLKKTYPCKFCNRVFARQSSLGKHRKQCGIKNKEIKSEVTGS